MRQIKQFSTTCVILAQGLLIAPNGDFVRASEWTAVTRGNCLSAISHLSMAGPCAGSYRRRLTLNDAVNVSHLLPFNPAAGIFKSKGAKKSPRIRPLLWTAERVDHWQETGKIPAKVMVWTSAQCGNFLDFTEASGRVIPRSLTVLHADSM